MEIATGIRPLRGTIALLGFAVMIGAIYAFLFSDFVPSKAQVRLAEVCAVICGTGGILLALAPQPKTRPLSKWLSVPWIRLPAFALLFGAFGYEAFVAGFPAWYTLVFGHESTMEVTVDSWRMPGRGTCGGPNLVEAPMTATICLSISDTLRIPPGTRLILKGPKTGAGIIVRMITVAGG